MSSAIMTDAGEIITLPLSPASFIVWFRRSMLYLLYSFSMSALSNSVSETLPRLISVLTLGFSFKGLFFFTFTEHPEKISDAAITPVMILMSFAEQIFMICASIFVFALCLINSPKARNVALLKIFLKYRFPQMLYPRITKEIGVQK